MRSAPWVEPALDEADLVLPMPLSRQRLAERGFNQALMLARRLAPAKTDAATCCCDVRHTARRAALDRKDRLRNVQGRLRASIRCAPPRCAAGASCWSTT